MKKIKSLVLRFLISCGLLYVISYKVDFSQLKGIFDGASLSLLFLSVVVLFIGQFLMVLALFELLRAKDHDVSYKWLAWDFFISSFLGGFLPSTLGGDVVRSYAISKRIKNPYDGVCAMLLLRLISVVVLLLFGLISSLFYYKLIPQTIVNQVFFAYFGCFFALGMLIPKTLRKLMFLILDKAKLGIVREKIEKVVKSIIDYQSNYLSLTKFVLITILIQINKMVFSYVLAKSLNINCDFGWFFVFIPLTSIITAFPSIGGLGVREGAFVFCFGPLIGTSAALALSLSHFVLGGIFVGIGGVMFLLVPLLPVASQKVLKVEK